MNTIPLETEEEVLRQGNEKLALAELKPTMRTTRFIIPIKNKLYEIIYINWKYPNYVEFGLNEINQV